MAKTKRKPTQASGAAEERGQALDHIQVLRKRQAKMTAEEVLDDMQGWLQSRTERTRATKGGL